MKRKTHRRVYEILKEWAVQEYEVINKKVLQETTLGISILATGGGGDPDALEDEIEGIYVAKRRLVLTNIHIFVSIIRNTILLSTNTQVCRLGTREH